MPGEFNFERILENLILKGYYRRGFAKGKADNKRLAI